MKWISRLPSKQLFQVRILAGAQKSEANLCSREAELLQLRRDSKGFSLSSLRDLKSPVAVAENPNDGLKETSSFCETEYVLFSRTKQRVGVAEIFEWRR